jgi:acyl-homoserine-lactone acylase
MKKFAFSLLVITAFFLPQSVRTQESTRWDERARNVTITRDDWGIAHIHG